MREIVPVHDGRQENQLFILSFVVVLLMAASLLWLTHDDHAQQVRLPNPLSNVAMQLSIASDEIVMLQEVGLLSASPTLAELQENALAPFTTHHFTTPQQNCFVTSNEHGVVRLLKHNQTWQVQWRIADAHDEHQNEQCELNDHWFAVTSPQ